VGVRQGLAWAYGRLWAIEGAWHPDKIDLRCARRSGIYIVIPATRKVKGYTRFVGKYVAGRSKRFQPHKVYIFLITITSRVDLAMSVCPYERWDLGTIISRLLGLGTQVPDLPAQRKFVSARCQAYSSCCSYSFDARIQILTKMYCSHQYLSIYPKKSLHPHFNAHKLQKIVYMNADISEDIKIRELRFHI